MTKRHSAKIPSSVNKRDPEKLPISVRNDTDRATLAAKLVTLPSRRAAHALGTIEGIKDDPTIRALTSTMEEQTHRVKRGDLGLADQMLVAQAHTLDAIFSHCVQRAAANLDGHIGAAETYMRLGLKAQSQCRTTLETLANIKNPPTVFARQANIAHGLQQVNNGTASASRAANSGRLNPLRPHKPRAASCAATSRTARGVGDMRR